MKNLGFSSYCNFIWLQSKEFDDPPSDSKVANEQKLSAIREIIKTLFLIQILQNFAIR